ncbi:hypothetical protein J056_002171 [Wallemia ichthyophaga EXF-994]|uniref:F-box domain-containing protein n=1 Tax=Wallemia ichthyophaga (strain EXF-994 / CBS 113033) TaxID=1299270 RepID=R9API3_WALI9|nr:uncharacterized protein J056_002171 [Wallemia ichthyophaga EXF-994]EOR04093.1 hypothetical protein J056_002171 [Wallemia ichthyophaga EXF-994]
MKQLPIELINEVIYECTKPTLKQLRLVNTQLNELIADSLFESCYYSPELLSSDKVALVKNLIVENDPSLDTLLETLPRFNHLNSITLSPTLATLIFEDPALDSTMALQKACPSLRQVTFAGDQVFKIVNQPSGIEFFKTKISDCNDVNLCSSCDCSPNRYQPKLMLRKRRTLRVAY